MATAMMLTVPAACDAQSRPDELLPPESGVRVNRTELSIYDVESLATKFRVQVVPGDYWYDRYSGLFGLIGGPGLGFTMPGLLLGGELPADASGSHTNVFVNGRELHPLDVAALSPWDRSTVGGTGFGRPATTDSTYGGHIGSDGQTSCFFDGSTGCSAISGGGVSC